MPGLDGMRALAVVAVMIYHANNAWLPGGFLGVEVFFVISGYLITLLLISEHERTGRVSLGNFYVRRARRLLPALFTLLILLTVYTVLFRRDALGELRGDVIAGLLYVTNWYQIWVGQGYTAAGDFAPLRHLWSLAVEEQFYLLWPLAMIGLLRLGRRRLPEMGLRLFGVSLAITGVMALLYYPGPIQTCAITPDAYWEVVGRCISKTDALYLATPTRLGGLMLGAGFAMLWRPVAIMRGPMREHSREVDVIAVCGLIGLGALCWYLHVVTSSGRADPWLFRGGLFLTGVATLAVMAAVTHHGAITGRVLSIPLLLWIGTRSYGLYLYHWPIYQIMRRVAGNALTVAQFAGALAITAVITELSFRVIETPIRRGTLRRWWRRLQASSDPAPRRVIAGIGASVVAVSLFAGVNLATAELKPNEIEASIEEGREATGDPFATAPPTAPPSGGSAPVAPTEVPGNAPDSTPDATTPTTPTTAPPTTIDPDDPCARRRIRRYAIGDSVMLGAAPELKAAGFCVDAIESRSFDDGVERLARLRADGRLGRAVVVNVGLNSSLDSEDLEQMMVELTDVPQVVVLTMHVDLTVQPNLGFTIEDNDLVRALEAEYPNVTVVDWATLGNTCANCFYPDGYHLRPEGQVAYTKAITDALG